MTRFDEMTAEAMFDNLGYHKKIEVNNLLEYKDDLGKVIRFDKPTTMVEKFVETNDYDDCHYTYGMFTPREIIAISQQFIELGILNGELLEADYPVLEKLNILEDKHKNIDKNLLIDLEKIEKRKWSK